LLECPGVTNDARVRVREVVASRLRRVIVMVAAICLAQCAPGSRAGSDLDELRALHEKVLRAHRQSDVELILEDESAGYVLADRGEITHPTLDERRARLGSYLRSTSFREYRDATDPVIAVSSDGSMGWVIVQVQASGIQTAENGDKEPLEFVSAWIELYEKRNGRWLRIGNVSNFKP
jgi:hypothetical protein